MVDRLKDCAVEDDELNILLSVLLILGAPVFRQSRREQGRNARAGRLTRKHTSIRMWGVVLAAPVALHDKVRRGGKLHCFMASANGGLLKALLFVQPKAWRNPPVRSRDCSQTSQIIKNLLNFKMADHGRSHHNYQHVGSGDGQLETIHNTKAGNISRRSTISGFESAS